MRWFVICSVALSLALVPPISAQTPAGTMVIGSGSFSPIVKDLDRSLKFYRDLLGVSPPANAAPAAFGTDAALLNFLGTPSAQVRFDSVRIPGTTTNVEIVEFKDIDRKAVEPRLQDPGAVMLVLLVRDLDALLARVRDIGAPVVTAGGAPVSIGGNNRAVVIQDPDGFHIALLQISPAPETTAAPTSNVIGARVSMTVANTEQAMRVYHDVLGLQTEVRNFNSTDPALPQLLNVPGAQVRRSIAHIPGSPLELDFLEFKDIERKPVAARIQDPGAVRLQLRVREVDEAVNALKAAGGQVITTGGDGGPIDMRGLRVAVVRELNNVFLVIMAQSGQRR